MTFTVQEFALRYAEKLVEYHELNEHCKGSNLREDHNALRRVYDELCAAQNALNDACLRQAVMNFA